MLTALFIILMFAVFGKLILFAFKASWGILKVLLTIIIFPLFLIGLFVSGLNLVCNRFIFFGGKMFRAPHHGKPFRDGDFFMRFFWIIAQ